MKDKLTTEEIEVRVWAWCVKSVVIVFAISALGILYAVTFVEQDMARISPIDQIYLKILNDIMLLCVGVIGGIAGRKGAYAAANLATKKEGAE